MDISRRSVAVREDRVGEVCPRPPAHSVRIGNSFYIEVEQVTKTLNDFEKSKELFLISLKNKNFPNTLSGPYTYSWGNINTKINIISIVAAFSIHSYGNVIIFPWGYAPNMEPHDNVEEMARLAYKMVNDIKWYTKDRELYVPGTAYQAV